MSNPLEKFRIPHSHPRLLGPRSRLQALAKQRPEAYARMIHVARTMPQGDNGKPHDFSAHCSSHCKLISMALVAAIEQDAKLGREAVEKILAEYIDLPIRVGHVPFGADNAICAIVYDMCHESWTREEQARFHVYFGRTRDANVEEEPHVFHNGWYGYKNWGFGLACLATMYEYERAPELLASLDHEYRTRAAPALEFSGDGGGFGEGFYTFYWNFEWLFCLESMRLCAGVDWYFHAPKFYKNRAVASMFEMYPGIRENNSRRPICVGDGRGRFFKVERDKAQMARRISVSRFKDDPDHQVVHAYDQLTPKQSAPENAYRDFLFADETVKSGNLKDFKLSHCSTGPGHVYARSSWDDDATYLFFKCGKRFTSHQHLDVGHFYIYKHEELAGEGGHYDTFGKDHDTNYYIRSIAHNTMLINDPAERWPVGIRAFKERVGHDGGQAYPWVGTPVRHNGGAADVPHWYDNRELLDVADLLAYDDKQTFLYTAGDCTRAYSRHKLDYFTRQIVFIRPGSFVIFDRVAATDANFKKTWLLQAMKTPEKHGKDTLVVTNGKGRLFVQTVLPVSVQVKLNHGADLYAYGGTNYPPTLNTGPEAECRVEVSPAQPAKVDFFLHVLTATDASVKDVPQGAATVSADAIALKIGNASLQFLTGGVGGSIELAGVRHELKKTF
jgi:hypothetical protein